MNLQEFKDFSNFYVDRNSIELFLAMSVAKHNRIAYFPSIDYDVKLLKRNLLRINPNLNILEFPNFDCNFFSNVSPTSKNKSQRIETLYNLMCLDIGNTVLLSSLESLITKTIKIKNIENSILSLKNGSKIKYEKIINFLNKSGYERVDFVNNSGEFSIRGEILDIFSPINEMPVRILFNFNNIESLNLFEVANQLSYKSIDKYELFLSSEFQFNKENIQCFRRLFRKLKISDKDDYYKSISEENILPGSGQFFPILNEDYSSILNYLQGFKIVLDFNYIDEFNNNYQKTLEDLVEYKNYFVKESKFYLKSLDLKRLIQGKELLLHEENLITPEIKIFLFSKCLELKKNRNDNLKKVLSFLKEKQKIIFCFFSKINRNKIKKFLDSEEIIYKNIDSFNLKDISKSKIKSFIYEFEISSSFIFQKEGGEEFYFISDQDIFGKTVKEVISKSIKEENLIEEYSELKFGDYIVHNDHGIGKYNGLKIKIINNIAQEFIEMIYQGNDKLLIPVENLELISKYGQSEIQVNLDKLGLQNWQHRKAVIKNRIKDIAKVLIKTAAERQLKKGDILTSKILEYEKFSSEFEFTETSDQLKSIHQIENDLSSGLPMDRLICGDVGFGKTEIAMRAAFIAASSGYQVAIICPKLLLVNQHAKNFCKRFKNFNYTIEKISRLDSAIKRKKIKEEVENGYIDILIGTHAILSDDLFFKNLGLIIIDEEQSFGVEQKEKLKKIKPNCHVLTLSATPIPRTLQSSIFQLKDISLIKTPPLNRMNIKTFLMLYDKNEIKKIINKEISRDGQIFYVAPRIKDLDSIKKKLINLIPDLKYEIIHGQLQNKKIEESYDRFFKKQSNLLISTAMIESGLDVSNVNTIIIEKPHLFGLAQLYQLRGRVGRSSRQAYAYLILNDFRNIGENSLKKLQIISKITSLGAGFSIASNDLDIRGGGNIIGSEQSGHIREVGLELYYKMLKETIKELKNSNYLEDDWSPSIKLGFPVSIPSNYIEDLDIRMNLYRKISNISEIKELKLMLITLKDRFGDIPSSFKNLFHIIEIKILAKQIFVKKIDYSNKGFVLEFKTDRMLDVEKLIKLVKKNPKILKLMPGSKLFYRNDKIKDVERVQDLKNLLSILLR